LLHCSGFQAVITEPLPSNGHIRHNILTKFYWRSLRGSLFTAIKLKAREIYRLIFMLYSAEELS
jgi:hypothetical protein